MEKTVKVRAYIEMDMEVPEGISNSDTADFAIDALKTEINNNIFNFFLSAKDFEYEVLEIKEGSLLDGTGEYA